MGKIVDLTGQRFGKLLVLEKTDKRDKRNNFLYKCQCDCGGITYLNCNVLKRGNTKSCGCGKFATRGAEYNSKDYTGTRFGKLVAIERLRRYKHNVTYYKCKCDCGNIAFIMSGSLVAGTTKSCGCERYKRKIKQNRYEFDEKCAYIYVTGRKEPAIIDIEDYEKVKKYHWNNSSLNYTISHIFSNKKHKSIPLHRLIMGVEDKKTKINIDHINGNVLDNRKCNLRFATQMQNCWNRRLKCTNTSGVTGVRREHKGNTWHAEIMVNYKIINLGNYRDINEAIKARKEAEIQYFGEYRRKNNEENTD